jgi:hypothetical protein
MSLTEDAIRDIFDIIFNAGNGAGTPPWRELSNLALVCRGWSGHAQALLFSYVRIHTPHQLESFLFATNPKTERGRLLGATVRIINVTVYPWKYLNRVPDTRLPGLLSRCTRLYELRLTLEEVYVWTDEVLEELRKTSPPILALRIRDSMAKGSAARQLLHIWPSVRHLVLRSSSIGLHSVYGAYSCLSSVPATSNLFHIEDEPSPKFQLFEFRYEGNHPQSIRFLQWLFRYQYEHPELGSYLRILHLSVPLADDSQGELASMYGRRLHSIRIPRPDWILLKSATSLREIYLRHDEDVSEGLLLALPPAIEHIACTTHNNRTLAIERVLQVKGLRRGLGSLRAMTLYCPKTEPQADWDIHWSKLTARAQRAGFDLVRQDDRSFLVGGVSTLSYYYNNLNTRVPRVKTWSRPSVILAPRLSDNSGGWPLP